ncbi:VOC family protein [Planococcus koreensis]|uniref:VOC family protein n=1 Tax=Planococcus koreensis TaxID=112331 RepID=UPI0039FCF7EE
MIHHIELNVSDLKKSREFYAALLPELGYSIYQEWPEGFSYRNGHSYVVFVQTAENFLSRPYHRKAPGLNHLAFHAAAPAVVDRLAGKMRGLGVSMLYEDRYPYAGGPHHYAVFMEDPDRMKIEIAADGGIESEV